MDTDRATPARQIVYEYATSERGSGPFAIWHLGTDVVGVYGPEGDLRRILALAAPAREDAGHAAASYAAVIRERESSSLYPQNVAAYPATIRRMAGALASFRQYPPAESTEAGTCAACGYPAEAHHGVTARLWNADAPPVTLHPGCAGDIKRAQAQAGDE